MYLDFQQGHQIFACYSLSLERIHFFTHSNIIPVFYMAGTVPDSRETEMQGNTEPPLPACPPGPVLRARPHRLHPARDLWDSPSVPHPSLPHSSPEEKPPRFPMTPHSSPSTVTNTHWAHHTQGPTPPYLPQTLCVCVCVLKYLTHNVHFAILAILSVQFHCIKHFHIVLQPSPPSVSRTFLIFPDSNSTLITH